jgi:poly-beta-1,6-N-acetyl-D-glucosamine synthase
MNHAQTVLVPLITAFNILILSYFLLGNGIYTYLMVLSLRSSLAHARRTSYRSLDALRQSPMTPLITIIIPAWNEQEVIVDTVSSALQSDYPRFEVLVVDDGSTDLTLDRLIAIFGLVAVDKVYYPGIPTAHVKAFYANPQISNLLVVSKRRGGKPDALNTGINLSDSPYFCSLDADCLLERHALLRLMDPVLNSSVQTVASGGIVRILNGCQTNGGRVVKVGLPSTWLERFQVVE